VRQSAFYVAFILYPFFRLPRGLRCLPREAKNAFYVACHVRLKAFYVESAW
jgi:hypothetical protein